MPISGLDTRRLLGGKQWKEAISYYYTSIGSSVVRCCMIVVSRLALLPTKMETLYRHSCDVDNESYKIKEV